MKTSSDRYLIISATDTENIQSIFNQLLSHLLQSDYHSLYVLHHSTQYEAIKNGFNKLKSNLSHKKTGDLIEYAKCVELPKVAENEDLLKYSYTLSKLVLSLIENANASLNVDYVGSDQMLSNHLSSFLCLYSELQNEFSVINPGQLNGARSEKHVGMLAPGLPSVVKKLNGNKQHRKLFIDLANKKIIIDDQVITLPPTLFIWYGWIAMRRKQYEKIEEAGINVRGSHHNEYIQLFKRVYGANHYLSEKVEEGILKDGRFTSNYMSEKKNRVNKALYEAGLQGCEDFSIVLFGEWPNRSYSIKLPAENIVVMPIKTF